MHKLIVRAVWFIVAYPAIYSVAIVCAQNNQPPNKVEINVDAHRGGTPLSYQIESEAKYIRAQGQFLESAATARKINAEAVEQEIKNSVEYVKAYFERKDVNNEWRRKNEWKTYFESLDRQQKATEQRIDKYFHETLKGDVTSELNYLLQKLYFVQYMSPGDLKPLDSPLSREDLEQIYLTDGKLVFKAGDAEMLKTPWPYVLRGSDFAQERKEFEDSRDLLVREINENGRAGEESGKRIWKAVNQLLVTLETAYPPQKRRDFNDFQQYNSSKMYLNSLIVQVNHALKTNDCLVFNGSLSFNGSTLLDLIQHMCKSGLMFSKPQPGGERFYKPLFTNMRHLYLTLGSDRKDGGQTPARN